MRRALATFALVAIFASNAFSQETAPIGKPVNFRLPDVSTGNDVPLSDFKGKVVVVIFYSHTCTFCRNYESRFRQLAADKRIAVVAIDSTGRSTQDAVAAWKKKDMGFPLLCDARAETAASFGAAAMTTVCVIDAHGKLRYHGAFDDCESGKDVRTRFAADAVTALLAGKAVPREQTEVYGCLIPLPR